MHERGGREVRDGKVKIVSAIKDEPHVTPEWEIAMDLIDGVRIREVRNVVTANGITTELHRDDWGIVPRGVEQVIHVSLRAGAVSAWHMHERKTDHLIVVAGHLRAVLYDGREDSPTTGRLNVFHLSLARPTLVVIPPLVWHGIQNLSDGPSTFVNYFDEQYDYANPDDWRLPADSDEIPYRFP
jgi:dTDP-4-dehydrorhamnose 3,5-epimerase